MYSIGFCLLLALAVDRLQRACSTVPRLVVWAVVLGVLALYGTRSWARNEDWRTPRVLYLSSLEAAPSNAKLHHNAAYYMDTATEAVRHRRHGAWVHREIDMELAVQRGGGVASVLCRFNNDAG